MNNNFVYCVVYIFFGRKKMYMIRFLNNYFFLLKERKMVKVEFVSCCLRQLEGKVIVIQELISRDVIVKK